MSKVFAFPDQALVDPVTIFEDACTGCNLCLHVCPVDLFLPNVRKGGPPLVLYPGECWFEGSCVDVCPEPGAIVLNRPPATRVNWKPRRECHSRPEAAATEPPG
jgi:NAD-dependent dihydropyrimidine dehydrogenase PreA subunit